MTVVRRGCSFMGVGIPGGASVENHGPIAAKKNAVFEYQSQRPRQDELLDVVPGQRQVLRRVGVVHRDNLLDDTRSLIQPFGDKVRSGADDLYAALKRLVVRARAGKRREEGMMNVDD